MQATVQTKYLYALVIFVHPGLAFVLVTPCDPIKTVHDCCLEIIQICVRLPEINNFDTVRSHAPTMVNRVGVKQTAYKWV